MANLWKRWWFRALMGLLATPFVTSAGAFPVFISIGFLVDGYIDWSELAKIFPTFSLAEIAVVILPWIAMEIGNRQRRRPLSPGLTAAWLCLSSACLAGLIALLYAFRTWFPTAHVDALMSDIRTGLPISLIVYIAPFLLAWLTIRPLIVRWANAAGVADNAAVF